MSNLSEEEKKAKLKSLIEEYEICYKESKYEGNVEEYKSLKETHKLFKDILNLIDRLQKENEELKNYKERTEHTIKLAKATQKENVALKQWVKIDENGNITPLLENYVSKDKIRDKIKELEEQCKEELLTTWLEAKIEVLEELLKEN